MAVASRPRSLIGHRVVLFLPLAERSRVEFLEYGDLRDIGAGIPLIRGIESNRQIIRELEREREREKRTEI